MFANDRPLLASEPWPALPLEQWQPTLDTLHMWLQVIGKITLALAPYRNQWWHVTLHPTARGLTTGVIPYGDRAFEIDLDFLDHTLCVSTSDGGIKALALRPQTVAAFYHELMDALAALGIEVAINPIPVEVLHVIPCDTNDVHKDYDGEYVTRWWRVLLATTRVLQRHNVRFTGKSSPPQLFWGSFDLNLTRFSGRPADPPVGAPRFVRLAENEENVSCGFWPGNTSMSGVTLGEPAFYAYCYPQPAGYAAAKVGPAAASFDERMGEFILRYEDVRRSPTPDQDLLAFFESTYESAAEHGRWDRARLELDPASIR